MKSRNQNSLCMNEANHCGSMHLLCAQPQNKTLNRIICEYVLVKSYFEFFFRNTKREKIVLNLSSCTKLSSTYVSLCCPMCEREREKRRANCRIYSERKSKYSYFVYKLSFMSHIFFMLMKSK